MPFSTAWLIILNASRLSGVVKSDSTYVLPSKQLSTEENSAALPLECAFKIA